MTSLRQGTQTGTPDPQLTALRGNCMGAGVLLIIQFALGTGVNLYVTAPEHTAFLSSVFGSAVLAAHANAGLVLFGAAIGAVIRAIRVRTAIIFTSTGLAAVVAAAIAGAAFVTSHGSGASLAMALATAVAMFCYLAAVFSLR